MLVVLAHDFTTQGAAFDREIHIFVDKKQFAEYLAEEHLIDINLAEKLINKYESVSFTSIDDIVIPDDEDGEFVGFGRIINESEEDAAVEMSYSIENFTQHFDLEKISR